MNTERPDELRQRLRALGYLNAPVNRFVLGGAADRRSNVSLAASASARIGLIAGLLLGPAGAVGLLSKLPELITSTSDALVIAVPGSPRGALESLAAVEPLLDHALETLAGRTHTHPIANDAASAQLPDHRH